MVGLGIIDLVGICDGVFGDNFGFLNNALFSEYCDVQGHCSHGSASIQKNDGGWIGNHKPSHLV